MEKRSIITLVFLLALLAYASFHGYFSREAGGNNTVRVIINDEGFFPDKISISSGSTVSFVNQGERLHWPASNFHPTHTLYPEEGGCLGSKFDACKGLKKGESYSFQFNILGIWPAHDHLSAGHVMTIEVVDAKEAEGAESIKKYIYNQNTSPEDFRKLDYGEQLDFIKSMSAENPVAAWAYLKDAFIVDGRVMGNAHELSHIIGNTAYKNSGLSGIKICDETFAFGCFHGVTEAMLLKEGTKRIKSIEEECLKLYPPSISQDYTGCIHGTGHGVFTWEGEDLGKALTDCDIISEPYRQYCYDGVFMENSGETDEGVILSDNPWSLCSDLPERYHRNCARYQSLIFLRSPGQSDSIRTAGAFCGKGPSLLLRETCYESLGYYAAQNSLGDPELAWEKCSGMPDYEGVNVCVSGAAKETVFQRYGNFEKSARALCSRLSGPIKSECETNINRMISE